MTDSLFELEADGDFGPNERSNTVSNGLAGNRPALLALSATAILSSILVRSNANPLFFALAAIPAVVFSLRAMLAPLVRFAGISIPFAMIWIIFQTPRGVADDTRLAGPVRGLVWHFERWLLGGDLLNKRLQDVFFDPTHLGVHDAVLAAVYGTFLGVQLLGAVGVGWGNSGRMRQHLVATALVLGVGLILHFAIPTNPPWLPPTSSAETAIGGEDHVYRITVMQLGQRGEYTLEGDKNSIAAMPSIHLATTLLLVFAIWPIGRFWRLTSLIYLGVMSFTLIYLGEHYILDELVGIVLAVYCWRWTTRLRVRWESQFLTYQAALAGTWSVRLARVLSTLKRGGGY